jgi:hypothetical protein
MGLKNILLLTVEYSTVNTSSVKYIISSVVQDDLCNGS